MEKSYYVKTGTPIGAGKVAKFLLEKRFDDIRG
jgi:hypothetical protein